MLNFPFIIKKDGRREPYTKEKVLKGLQAACQKRPVSLAQMETLVERISHWILNRPEKEVPATLVGQRVMQELRRLDDVAYVRFASVYRTFKDVQEFVETLEDEPPMEGDLPENQLALASGAAIGPSTAFPQTPYPQDIENETSIP
jgi:transcriptional repressor NrdR